MYCHILIAPTSFDPPITGNFRHIVVWHQSFNWTMCVTFHSLILQRQMWPVSSHCRKFRDFLSWNTSSPCSRMMMFLWKHRTFFSGFWLYEAHWSRYFLHHPSIRSSVPYGAGCIIPESSRQLRGTLFSFLYRLVRKCGALLLPSTVYGFELASWRINSLASFVWLLCYVRPDISLAFGGGLNDFVSHCFTPISIFGGMVRE